MFAKLPNLELLEYQAKQIIAEDKEAIEKIKKRYCNVFPGINPKQLCIELQCSVFPQMWGSTSTAFDICEDGSPAWGGSAMTEAYTTVFTQPDGNIYIVFIDNRFCYKVTDPTDVFLEDLKQHNLKPLSRAAKEY